MPILKTSLHPGDPLYSRRRRLRRLRKKFPSEHYEICSRLGILVRVPYVNTRHKQKVRATKVVEA